MKVRSKLTALVALSGVIMVLALPILSWLLHRQLVDEVDDRVTEAERAFQLELDDDLGDLTLVAHVVSTENGTAHAIARNDAKKAEGIAAVVSKIYPEIDILFVRPDGTVLAQIGCVQPLANVASAGDLKDALGGKEVRGVVAHGCESSAEAAPAYVIASPVQGVGGATLVGAVVVCLPLDKGYLENASKKLGLELALAVVEPQTAKVLDATSDFPRGSVGSAKRAESSIVESGPRTWALARFEPKQLVGAGGPTTMVAALDVTDIGTIVRRNLLQALAVLLLPAFVSIVIGWRLASVMSRALDRVNVALKRVEQLDYVHVQPIRTGDELEDLATVFNTMVDGLKERDNLRMTFGKYMTESVMDHLLSGKVQLGGEDRVVTILFTDIRGFTTISEKMDAQSLVALLNEYFTEMVGIVMQEDGVVDKYIGDAIMAVFGAPVERPDDAIRAVRAAVRMRKALETLNARLIKRGLEPLRTGIGIHTGEVVSGNIGHEKRMEYTVVGDAVNLASRLESATKELAVDILISEDTWKLTRDAIDAKPIREITVKGREAPVMAYEVRGMKP